MIRVLQTIAASVAKKGTSSVLTVASNQQLNLVQAKCINLSGSSADLGLFRKLANGFTISTLVGTTLTDVTAALKAGTATSLITTTNNDGFMVGANEIFGLVGLLISQADSGSPVYTLQYWNGASFASLTAYAVPTAYTAAEQLIVFAPPADWALGGAISSVSGINQNQYNILVRATTAPSQAVQASSAAWVAQLLDFAPAVASNGSFDWRVASTELAVKWEVGDALLPYFSVAGAKNTVIAQYWRVSC